jgi:hypothetical protein
MESSLPQAPSLLRPSRVEQAFMPAAKLLKKSASQVCGKTHFADVTSVRARLQSCRKCLKLIRALAPEKQNADRK